MYYIQESDKPNFWCKTFNILKLKSNKILLPVEEKMDIKKSEVIAYKTKKIIDSSNCKKVVLSKKIKEQEDYINFLKSYDFKVADGRMLFKELIIEVLEYIIEKLNIKNEITQKGDLNKQKDTKRKSKQIQISILINDVDEHMLQNIKQIIKTYKKVNIVTNHFEKFKNLEEQMLEQDGIAVFVSNNKRKSISNSQIILNIDFPSELINDYKICENAIIVNFRKNVIIKQKRFNGINIKDYEINLKSEEENDCENEELYSKKDIYEAKLDFRKPIAYIKEKLEKDKVKIEKLQAINTVL